MKGKKDRELSKRPEKYDTMSVEGAPIFHPTDGFKVPGRIIERKPGKKPRWDYFPKDGLPEVVTKAENRGTSLVNFSKKYSTDAVIF